MRIEKIMKTLGTLTLSGIMSLSFIPTTTSATTTSQREAISYIQSTDAIETAIRFSPLYHELLNLVNSSEEILGLQIVNGSVGIRIPPSAHITPDRIYIGKDASIALDLATALLDTYISAVPLLSMTITVPIRSGSPAQYIWTLPGTTVGMASGHTAIFDIPRATIGGSPNASLSNVSMGIRPVGTAGVWDVTLAPGAIGLGRGVATAHRLGTWQAVIVNANEQGFVDVTGSVTFHLD